MKIRVSTAAGETLYLIDVLQLLRIEAYRGRPVGVLQPGSVIVAEVISDAAGACVRLADDRDGKALSLREFVVVPVPEGDDV